MMSVSTTKPDFVDAGSSAPHGDSARLSLKPPGSARGALDGAWWPRSTDPTVELTALLEAVGARRMPVSRIALNMDGWDGAPPHRIRLDSGRKVAVDWFRTSGAHLVRILYADHRRIDLLLIPLDTEDAAAELALMMATNGQDPVIAYPGRDRSPHSEGPRHDHG